MFYVFGIWIFIVLGWGCFVVGVMGVGGCIVGFEDCLVGVVGDICCCLRCC